MKRILSFFSDYLNNYMDWGIEQVDGSKVSDACQALFAGADQSRDIVD